MFNKLYSDSIFVNILVFNINFNDYCTCLTTFIYESIFFINIYIVGITSLYYILLHAFIPYYLGKYEHIKKVIIENLINFVNKLISMISL